MKVNEAKELVSLRIEALSKIILDKESNQFEKMCAIDNLASARQMLIYLDCLAYRIPIVFEKRSDFIPQNSFQPQPEIARA